MQVQCSSSRPLCLLVEAFSLVSTKIAKFAVAGTGSKDSLSALLGVVV